MIKVSTTGMEVSLKTDLRFPIPGQQGHGGRIIQLTRIQEHAKIAGATYKMGNKVLVNTEIFEAYLERFRIPGDYEGMARKFTPDFAGLYR